MPLALLTAATLSGVSGAMLAWAFAELLPVIWGAAFGFLVFVFLIVMWRRHAHSVRNRLDEWHFQEFAIMGKPGHKALVLEFPEIRSLMREELRQYVGEYGTDHIEFSWPEHFLLQKFVSERAELEGDENSGADTLS